jgi:hypothetical protein
VASKRGLEVDGSRGSSASVSPKRRRSESPPPSSRRGHDAPPLPRGGSYESRDGSEYGDYGDRDPRQKGVKVRSLQVYTNDGPAPLLLDDLRSLWSGHPGPAGYGGSLDEGHMYPDMHPHHESAPPRPPAPGKAGRAWETGGWHESTVGVHAGGMSDRRMHQALTAMGEAYDQAKARVESADAEIKRLRGEMEGMDKERNEYRLKVLRLDALVRQERSVHNQEKEVLKAGAQEVQHRAAELERQLKALREQENARDTREARHHERLSDMERELMRLRGEEQARQMCDSQRISDLEAELKRLRDEKQSLRPKTSELQRTMNLEREIADLEVRLRREESRCRDLAREAQSLRQAQGRWEHERDDLEAKAKRAQAEVAPRLAGLAQLLEACGVSGVEAAVGVVRRAVGAAAEADKWKKRAEELSDRLSAEQAESTTLDVELDAARRRTKELEAQVRARHCRSSKAPHHAGLAWIAAVIVKSAAFLYQVGFQGSAGVICP